MKPRRLPGSFMLVWQRIAPRCVCSVSGVPHLNFKEYFSRLFVITCLPRGAQLAKSEFMLQSTTGCFADRLAQCLFHTQIMKPLLADYHHWRAGTERVGQWPSGLALASDFVDFRAIDSLVTLRPMHRDRRRN